MPGASPKAREDAQSYPPSVSRPRWSLRVLWSHGGLRFAVLTAVCVLLAHDAVCAAGVALGAVDGQFADEGHRYLATFRILVLLAAGVTAGAGLAALARLGRSLRRLPTPSATQQGPGYGAELLRLWPRLFPVVAVVFVLQENVEHFAAGEPMPGLWAPRGSGSLARGADRGRHRTPEETSS